MEGWYGDGVTRTLSEDRLKVIGILLALVMMLTMVPFQAPEPVADIRSHVHTFSFQTATMDGPDHQPFQVEGAHYGALGSSPYALPMISEEVALPLGAVSLVGLRVTGSSPMELGPVEIPPLVYGNSLSTHVAEGGSELAYAGPMHERDGVPHLPISVTPISIDDGWATHHHEVTVEVIYEHRDPSPALGSSVLPLNDPYDMLIITSTSMMDEFDRLARWRGALGIDTKVVSVSQVSSLYPGVPIKEAIRAFAWQQHNTSGIDYLLLGGGAGIIPAHKITMSAGSYTEDIPADIYYGAFGGNVDWSVSFNPIVDVAVGRVPVSTVAGAANYVDKVIAYEGRSAGTELLFEVLFLGEKLDERVWGGSVKDTNLPLVPEEYNVTKLYERDNGRLRFLDVREVVSDAHIINNMGHGDFDFLATLRSWNVQFIENQLPYIWKSQGCNVGGFDRNPCVSNAMLADERNSVANIVNSRFGWYISGPSYPIGPSNLFDLAFMDLVFRSDGLLGDIHHQAKQTQVNNLSNEYIRWVYATLNLLGDPALKVGGYDRLPTMDIMADGDDDLVFLADIHDWQGDGSEASPYIISDMVFDGTEATVDLRNTTKHLVFRNNTLSGPGVGFSLDGVSNITLEDNTFQGKDVAIKVNGSLLTVVNNSFQDNSVGISSSHSEALVDGNAFIQGNDLALEAEESVLTISNNIFSRGEGLAVMLRGDGSDVVNNSFVENNGTAIRVKGEQAWNEGSNNWNQNWWSDMDGEVQYVLGGSGHDPSPRDTNINDAPVFSVADSSTNASVDLIDLRADADAGIEGYEVSVNGVPFCSLWENPIQAGDLCPRFGHNDITVKAYSILGNLGILDYELDYTTDLDPLHITSPLEEYVNISRPLLSWELEDDAWLEDYAYSLDGQPFTPISENSLIPDDLEDGVHELRVRAFAADGNYSFARKVFFVDTVAPLVSITSPKEGRLVDQQQWTVRWDAYDAGVEPSGLLSVVVSIGGTEHVLSGSETSLDVMLDEGMNEIRVHVTDMAGNEASDSISVMVDSQPPLVKIDEPDGFPLVGDTPTLTWNVTDNGSGVDKVLMRIDGRAPMDVTGRESRELRGLSPGYHLVEVIARDAVGNTAVESIGIVTGNTFPLLDITSPRNGHASIPTNITWDVWGDGDFTFGYVVDGVHHPTGTDKEANIQLPAGVHQVTVWAQEAEGQNLTRTMSFNVIEERPSLAWSSPADGDGSVLYDRHLLLRYDNLEDMDRHLTTLALRDGDGHRITGTWGWLSNGTLRFVPDANLENPQSFVLTVSATDLTGTLWNDTISFQTAPLTVPGRPINLQAQGVQTWLGPHVMLTWEEPFDDGGYPLEIHPLVYTVHRQDDDGEWESIGSTERLSFVDREVSAGERYDYFITTTNRIGESGPSLSANATVPAELEGMATVLSFLGFSIDLAWLNIALIEMAASEASEALQDLINSTLAVVGPLLQSGGEVLSDILDALGSAVSVLSDLLVGIGSAAGLEMGWLTPTVLSLMIITSTLALLIWRVGRSRLGAEFLPPEGRTRVMQEAEEIAQEILREELESSLEDGVPTEEAADLAERLSAVHLASYFRERGRRKF